MILWGEPRALYWLPLTLAIAAGLEWIRRRRAAGVEVFAPREALRRIFPGWSSRRWGLKSTLTGLAVCAAILAAARPQWGFESERVSSVGRDVLIVLDLSSSMDVEDVVPSRLKKAKHLIRSLVAANPGDRMGIVGFAASAHVVCPLTNDSDYLLEVLETLESRYVMQQGTDIGLALDTAARAMERGAEGGLARSVLLITDGEDQEDQFQAAGEKLRKIGARLAVVGVGTEKGGPIPVRDESGGLAGYKKEGAGNVVVSAFQSEKLSKLTEVAGGKYWRLSEGESEAAEIQSWIRGADARIGEDRSVERPIERYQWPLALALSILIAEWLLPASVSAAVLSLMLAAAGTAWSRQGMAAESAQSDSPTIDVYRSNRLGVEALKRGRESEAQEHFSNAQAMAPEDPVVRYNVGTGRLHAEDPKGAQSELSQSAKVFGDRGDVRMRGRAKYQEALARAANQDLDGAALAYVDAIGDATKAGDTDTEARARKNLELLAQQQQKQKQQQQQQEQQQKKEDRKGENQDGQSGPPKDDGNPPQEQKVESRKQKFKSERLSQEAAEKVMAELSEREKRLKGKLSERKRGAERAGERSRDSRKERDW